MEGDFIGLPFPHQKDSGFYHVERRHSIFSEIHWVKFLFDGSHYLRFVTFWPNPWMHFRIHRVDWRSDNSDTHFYYSHQLLLPIYQCPRQQKVPKFSRLLKKGDCNQSIIQCFLTLTEFMFFFFKLIRTFYSKTKIYLFIFMFLSWSFLRLRT